MSSDASHQRLRGRLAAYVLGALDDDEAREVRAHLATCLSCRRELRKLQRGAARLTSGPEPAPVEVKERIWDRIRRSARGRRRRRALEVVEDDEGEDGPPEP